MLIGERIRPNGWQRIGIVLLVIWFVGFAGYEAYVWLRSVQDFDFHEYPNVHNKIIGTNKTKRKRGFPKINPIAVWFEH